MLPLVGWRRWRRFRRSVSVLRSLGFLKGGGGGGGAFAGCVLEWVVIRVGEGFWVFWSACCGFVLSVRCGFGGDGASLVVFLEVCGVVLLVHGGLLIIIGEFLVMGLLAVCDDVLSGGALVVC